MGSSLGCPKSVGQWLTAIKETHHDILKLQDIIAFQQFQDIKSLIDAKASNCVNFRELNKQKRIEIFEAKEKLFSLDSPGIFFPLEITRPRIYTSHSVATNTDKKTIVKERDVKITKIALDLEPNQNFEGYIFGFTRNKWVILKVKFATVSKKTYYKTWLEPDHCFFKKIKIMVHKFETMEDALYYLISIGGMQWKESGTVKYSNLEKANRIGCEIHTELCSYIANRYNFLFKKLLTIGKFVKKTATEQAAMYINNDTMLRHLEFYVYNS